MRTEPWFHPGTPWAGVFTVVLAIGTMPCAGAVTAATFSATSSTQAKLVSPCDRPFATIEKIQGTATSSALVGQTVEVQGVVQHILHAKSKHPQLLLQSLVDDQSPATSDSLLVTDSLLAQKAKVGTVVHLRGTVREIDGMTSLTNTDNSFAAFCGSQPLRAAVPVKLSLETPTPWEAYEGMLLQFPQPLIINDTSQLARQGQLTVSPSRLYVATDQLAPGASAQAYTRAQNNTMLVLDDDDLSLYPTKLPYRNQPLTANSPYRLGDSLLQVQGVLVQQGAEYRLHLQQTPRYLVNNPRPPAPPLPDQGMIRVASFNVLNYFNGQTAREFPTLRGASSLAELQRQQQKIVSAIQQLNADIVGLMEIQNNGSGASSALASLVAALNAAGPAKFQAIVPDQTPGTDAIMVALIYQPTRVQPHAQARTLLTGPFAQGSRPPLAQTFTLKPSGQLLQVVVNHLKSKGGCPKQESQESDQQDGQGCWNPSRVQAVKSLAQWLQADAAVPTLLLGDFNAYRQEQPIRELELAGWQLLTREQDYSFHFQGRLGTLDHGFANALLQPWIHQSRHWAINADEPVFFDYNLEQKTALQQQQWFDGGPYRSSDHDPWFVDIRQPTSAGLATLQTTAN